jgi:trans-aconitate methyltransferase
VFSNAVLHWIDDQDAVLDSAADALRPGGRFVAVRQPAE